MRLKIQQHQKQKTQESLHNLQLDELHELNNFHEVSNDHNLGAENATHLTRGADTATRGGSPMTNKHLNDFHNLKFENGNDCPDLENSLESPSPHFYVAEKERIAVIPTL